MMRFLLPTAFAALLAGCGDAAGGRKAAPPLVTVAAVETTRFVERIDAVGTAVANEQVILAAPVTDRILRLNFDDGDFITRGSMPRSAMPSPPSDSRRMTRMTR